MTNQQAPEIYTLHTVPNKGERPWSGIYAVRADAEHDAKVMRDATGRDWSVVRLVVADTAATPTGPITRYEVVDCIDSKHVPAVIPNGAGPWVRYEDHIAAMVGAQQHAAHVQNPAEIEHFAGDVSKNGAESDMAQQPSPTAQGADPLQPLVDLQEQARMYNGEFTHAAQSVLEDAARWQWLADYLVGERTDLDEGIVACATIDDLRQFADAARKQGANHD